MGEKRAAGRGEPRGAGCSVTDGGLTMAVFCHIFIGKAIELFFGRRRGCLEKWGMAWRKTARDWASYGRAGLIPPEFVPGKGRSGGLFRGGGSAGGKKKG